MEPWKVCRQVVANSPHFKGELDPDPDPKYRYCINLVKNLCRFLLQKFRVRSRVRIRTITGIPDRDLDPTSPESSRESTTLNKALLDPDFEDADPDLMCIMC